MVIIFKSFLLDKLRLKVYEWKRVAFLLNIYSIFRPMRSKEIAPITQSRIFFDYAILWHLKCWWFGAESYHAMIRKNLNGAVCWKKNITTNIVQRVRKRLCCTTSKNSIANILFSLLSYFYYFTSALASNEKFIMRSDWRWWRSEVTSLNSSWTWAKLSQSLHKSSVDSR